MGKIKFFGVALGLLGNIMIGLALNQLIQTDSCGGVAMPPARTRSRRTGSFRS